MKGTRRALLRLPAEGTLAIKHYEFLNLKIKKNNNTQYVVKPTKPGYLGIYVQFFRYVLGYTGIMPAETQKINRNKKSTNSTIENYLHNN